MTVQYWNDFKDQRTLHPLRGDSDPNWKRQVSIEMITRMTEPYILCGDIQLPTEKNSSVSKWFWRSQNYTSSVETFKFQHKKQVSIEMITKMTEAYILWGDIQITSEKDNSVSIDLKDHKTLHPLWVHSNPNWKSQIIIEMITKMT